MRGATMSIQGDGHVHVYEEFELARLFEVALRRGRRLGGPLLLLLAETQGLDCFGWLARAAGVRIGGSRGSRPSNPNGGVPGRLRLEPTAEPGSLGFGAGTAGGCAGYLCAGRQSVSREGIEVLALALPDPDAEIPADGEHSAEALVRSAREQGAVAVLPWGVGKWSGERGRRIRALAAEPSLARDPLVLFGDSAHRFWPWPAPSVLRGKRVLAGTDPLPLPGAERRVARYGFRLRGAFDPERPGGSLREALAGGGPIERVGARASAPTVLLDQLRYRRRRKARPRGPSRAP